MFAQASIPEKATLLDDRMQSKATLALLTASPTIFGKSTRPVGA
jgi:hypothetical protein